MLDLISKGFLNVGYMACPMIKYGCYGVASLIAAKNVGLAVGFVGCKVSSKICALIQTNDSLHKPTNITLQNLDFASKRCLHLLKKDFIRDLKIMTILGAAGFALGSAQEAFFSNTLKKDVINPEFSSDFNHISPSKPVVAVSPVISEPLQQISFKNVNTVQDNFTVNTNSTKNSPLIEYKNVVQELSEDWNNLITFTLEIQKYAAKPFEILISPFLP